MTASSLLMNSHFKTLNCDDCLRCFNGIAILNLFSILGWGIDFATGALNKFDTKGYDITLDKE